MPCPFRLGPTLRDAAIHSRPMSPARPGHAREPAQFAAGHSQRQARGGRGAPGQGEAGRTFGPGGETGQGGPTGKGRAAAQGGPARRSWRRSGRRRAQGSGAGCRAPACGWPTASPARCSVASRGADGCPSTAGKRHRSVWRAAKDFYRKAYEDNVTGLSGMVAYNLLLSIFPLALLALFIAGRVLESGDLERSVLQDLQQLFPSATGAHAHPRRSTTCATPPRGSGWSRCRQRLDRLVLLGRAGYRVLPHLPRALPLLAGAEALRAGDARGGPAVHGGHGRGAHAPEPAASRAPTTFPSASRDVDGVIYGSRLAAGLLPALPDPLRDLSRRCPTGALPWRAIWPGALAATRGHRHRGLRRSRLPVNSPRSPVRDHVRVRADRAALVLRARADHPARRRVINAMRFELHETGDLAIGDD